MSFIGEPWIVMNILIFWKPDPCGITYAIVPDSHVGSLNGNEFVNDYDICMGIVPFMNEPKIL